MATPTATSQTPSLIFPRPIFAAISPHPFLQAHLTAPTRRKAALRANGRTPQEFRTPGINTGSLTHCNGSAVVRLGNTSVVCGVRAEILSSVDASAEDPRTDDSAQEDLSAELQELDSLRLLVPNVELSTGSTPHHIPGNAPTSAAQSLITRIRSLLLSTHLVRPSDLRILHTPLQNPDDPDEPPRPELKAYWVLYMDIFFISIDGNAFDAAWLSLLAALRKTRLPRAFWDEDMETILCDDDPAKAKSLRLRGLPVSASFAVFEGTRDWDENGEGDAVDWVLSDPDAFEEAVCREAVCVVVDCSEGKNGSTLRRVEKSGGGVVGREEMKDVVNRARERWAVVEGVLSKV